MENALETMGTTQVISSNSKTKKKVVEVERKVYSPEEIMIILGLSKTTTYQFLNKTYETQSPFKVIKINTVIRVPKEGFDKWLKIVS